MANVTAIKAGLIFYGVGGLMILTNLLLSNDSSVNVVAVLLLLFGTMLIFRMGLRS